MEEKKAPPPPAEKPAYKPDPARIPMPSMVRIAIVSSVLVVIVVGGIVVFRPFDDSQPPPKEDAQLTGSGRFGPCPAIAQQIGWIEKRGLKVTSGGVKEQPNTIHGTHPMLSCHGGEGENTFTFGAKIFPEAFDEIYERPDYDIEQRNRTYPLYEGTDLLAYHTRDEGFGIRVRADKGYEIYMAYTPPDSKVLTPEEVNEIANAVNIYLNKNH